jgi:hypothetical protein
MEIRFCLDGSAGGGGRTGTHHTEQAEIIHTVLGSETRMRKEGGKKWLVEVIALAPFKRAL